MKNILQKQVLLALISLGVSTQHAPQIFAMQPEKQIPFKRLDKEDQDILDDITQRYNLGNPGDYKGYIIPIFSSTAAVNLESKTVFFDGVWLKKASKKDKQFVSGHEFGHVVCPLSPDIKSNAFNRATIKSTIPAFCSMLAGGYIGERTGNKYDNPAIGYIAGMLAGSILGWTLSLPYFYKKELAPHLQENEYAADEIAVKTFNCHHEAINFFSDDSVNKLRQERDLAVKNGGKRMNIEDLKSILNPNPPIRIKISNYMIKDIDSHPSDKDRIARIQELRRNNEAKS